MSKERKSAKEALLLWCQRMTRGWGHVLSFVIGQLDCTWSTVKTACQCLVVEIGALEKSRYLHWHQQHWKRLDKSVLSRTSRFYCWRSKVSAYLSNKQGPSQVQMIQKKTETSIQLSQASKIREMLVWGGLMVSLLDPRTDSQCLSPCWGYCVLCS